MVLAVSLVLIVFATVLVFDVMTKSKLLPAQNLRYDITKVGIASIKSVCPNLTEATAYQYETCIEQLDGKSQSSLKTMSVPNLDEVVENGRPDFSKLLQKQHPDIYDAIIEQGNDFVLRFDIPTELYSRPQHSVSHNEIVLSYMRNALFCIDGKCSYPVNYTTWGINTIPLYADNPSLEVSPVYVFGKHVDWNYVMSLQDGLFVAKSTDLWFAKRFYTIYLNIEIMVFMLAFTGILFFLIWSSFVWKDYQDYSYLLYFGASFVFVAILDRQLSATLSETGMMTHYFVRSLAWANALLAMVAFTISTLRISQKHQLQSVVALGLFLLCAITFNWFYASAEESRNHLLNGNVQYGFSLLAGFLPAFICVLGAINCLRVKLFELKTHARESEQLALNKRMRQQIVFATFLAIFNWPSLRNFLNINSDLRPDSIFTIASAAAYIGIFVTLLRPSMLRLKRAIDLLDRASEASTMRLLLSPKRYLQWKSRKRSGIFIEADIKGSTSAIPELSQSMHTVMRVLRQALQADIQGAQRSILLAKPLGDAWVFIIPTQEGEELSTALSSTVELCRKNMNRYKHILQTTQRLLLEDRRKSVRPEQAIGVHLRVFAIEEFFLQDRVMSNTKKITKQLLKEFQLKVNIRKTLDSELDFIGEESHLFLRYLPKGPQDHISVAANRRVLESLELAETCSMLKLVDQVPRENKNSSFLHNKADDLDLCYSYVPADQDALEDNVEQEIA